MSMAENAPESINDTMTPSIPERSGEASQDAAGDGHEQPSETAPEDPQGLEKTVSDGQEIMTARLTPPFEPSHEHL